MPTDEVRTPMLLYEIAEEVEHIGEISTSVQEVEYNQAGIGEGEVGADGAAEPSRSYMCSVRAQATVGMLLQLVWPVQAVNSVCTYACKSSLAEAG